MFPQWLVLTLAMVATKPTSAANWAVVDQLSAAPSENQVWFTPTNPTDLTAKSRQLTSGSMSTEGVNAQTDSGYTASSIIESILHGMLQFDRGIVSGLERWASSHKTKTTSKDNSLSSTSQPTPVTQQPISELLQEQQQKQQQAAVATSIKRLSDNSAIVVVTDTKGNEHLTTIETIMASLGNPSETEIEYLLQEAGRSQKPSDVVPEIASDMMRPIRQANTQPTADPNQDSFVIQDEVGNIHIVTVQDIVNSLSTLDDQSLKSLLLDDPTINELSANSFNINSDPSFQAEITTSPVQPEFVAHPAPAPSSARPESVTSPHTVEIPTTVRHELIPSFETIINPENHVPSKLEPNNPQGSFGSQSISIVETGPNTHNDQADEVSSKSAHTQPVNEQPFKLTIDDILRSKNKIEQIPTPNLPLNNFNTIKIIKNTQQEPQRGSSHLLSLLNGGSEVLPGSLAAQAMSTTEPPTTTNPFQRLQAVGANIQKNAQSLMNRLQSLTQTSQQPTSTSSVGGSLMNFLTGLVGRPQTNPVAGQIAQPNQNTVKLFVRDKNAGTGQKMYGDLNIALPKPIHYLTHKWEQSQRQHQMEHNLSQQREFPTTQIAQPRAGVPADSNSEAEMNQDDALSSLTFLPSSVKDFISKQIHNKPKFHPRETGVNNFDARGQEILTGGAEIDRKSTISSPGGSQILRRIPASHGNQYPYQIPNADGTKVIFQIPPPNGPSPSQYPSGGAYKIPLNYATPSPYATAAPFYPKPHGPPPYSLTAHDDLPLFDVFFLADLNKILKFGDTNLTVGMPRIGDPHNFVNTDKHY